MAVGESRTSLECLWIKPRKRKVAGTCATDLHYVKHQYGIKHKQKSTTVILTHDLPTNVTILLLRGKQILSDGLKGSGTSAELVL